MEGGQREYLLFFTNIDIVVTTATHKHTHNTHTHTYTHIHTHANTYTYTHTVDRDVQARRRAAGGYAGQTPRSPHRGLGRCAGMGTDQHQVIYKTANYNINNSTTTAQLLFQVYIALSVQLARSVEL